MSTTSGPPPQDPTPGGEPQPTHAEHPDVTVPVKVCRHCSTESATTGTHCPECGASYIHGHAPVSSKKKWTIAAIGAAVIVLVLGVGGILWKVQNHKEVAAQQAAAQQAAEKRDAAQKAAAAQRLIREETVPEIEASVTTMARKDVAAGVLDGPIYSTSCIAAAGGSVDDLTDKTTKFSCLAVTKKNSDGSTEGYRFHALMDWNAGTYTYGIGD